MTRTEPANFALERPDAASKELGAPAAERSVMRQIHQTQLMRGVMTTREWLLKIAKAVEDWPTMPKDDVAVAMSVSTPAGAVAYILGKHIPTEERVAVSAALPTLNTDDFAAAAQRIREAAEALP